jgi:hypothetical protein
MTIEQVMGLKSTADSACNILCRTSMLCETYLTGNHGRGKMHDAKATLTKDDNRECCYGVGLLSGLRDS